ncbi:MAG TPA: [protein-PII] uridylyltransferase [Sandaracinaceae bacterium LLY-WYZ-13_1]|nr:[protein-PII] uridylyltransferase [Sandaracinaceae bacterium LLY-WYZ-13_1]
MPRASTRPAIDLAQLAPDLRETCDDYCVSYRSRLADAVRRGEGGVTVARMHARILDGLLGALFCAADAAARADGHRPAGPVALVAVGGYGRSMVGLCSDVDVLFLCDDPSDPYVRSAAEGLLYPLWDLGLDIGHAVRGVEDTLTLARDDLSTATTLLDMRWVAGDRVILDDLNGRARRAVFEPPALERFLSQLDEDRTARHERFGGSLYLLEPEVKRGCGGLRDLDVARWAAKARWGAERTEDLVKRGALLNREIQELETAREMIWRVRNLLHLRAGRRQDRLTFEDQEEIAVQLGFVPGVTLAVEQFMQAYYRHARVVEQTAERMLTRARHVTRSGPARKEDLGDGLLLFDGQVTMHESERLADDPVLALRFYEQVAKRELPPYPYARDAIARAAVEPEWCERLREAPDAARLFLSALTCTAAPPVKARSILAELHEVGLLLAMVPEFEPVTGRVQHDVYHVYTVDVHSVAAVNRLRAIKRGDYATELPLASRLAAELPRPETLFLGLLLHDIGKAHGKDHSRKGAKMAEPIAERLGLSVVDVAHVVWLVEEHLSLYHWATRRDTSDPEVVSEVAKQVGTLDRLRDLYLLTVADLSTTNPNAMTSWKARMLEDLYLAVAAALEGDGIEGAAKRADAIREEVRVGFVGDAGRAQLEAFLADMPDRYLLANPVDSIRQHARIARDRGDAHVHVATRPGPSPDVSELAVVTDDRPGLLADVAAALAANRLSIAAAQIYTREPEGHTPEAFDLFLVRRATVGAEGEPVDEVKLGRIRTDLEALSKGEVGAAELIASKVRTPSWARRHSPEVPTEIQVDNEASPRFTVIDVFTRDRPALLHTIARTLHEQGLTIGLSKVNTEGERAADVFYVLDASGEKVRDPARLRKLPTLLEGAIERLDARERAR